MDLSNGSFTSSPASPELRSGSTENKRANKPLVERKRRGRINKSIDELKEIVLQALNKDDKEYCKMEKADILEMVVRHLKSVRRSQLAMESVGTSSEPSSPGGVWGNYRAGFNECAAEVMQYMRTTHGVEPTVQMRMINHLSDCMQRVNVFPATALPILDVPAHVMTSRLSTSGQLQAVAALQSHMLQAPSSRPAPPPPAGVPVATAETALPGNPSPPPRNRSPPLAARVVTIKPEPETPVVFTCRQQTSPPPSSPVYGVRSDQIVPGSHSPEVDYENASMVSTDSRGFNVPSSTNINMKSSSSTITPATWAQYEAKAKSSSYSTPLKVKSHFIKRSTAAASSPYNLAMRPGHTHAPHRSPITTTDVWRPW